MKILILGGVLNIAFGLILGLFIAKIRMNQPSYSKYLSAAHIGALMWGPILISLAYAMTIANLSSALESAASWSMVISSGLLGLKDTLHWQMSTKDEFAERPSMPFILGGLSAGFSLFGIVIILAGVIAGL